MRRKPSFSTRNSESNEIRHSDFRYFPENVLKNLVKNMYWLFYWLIQLIKDYQNQLQFRAQLNLSGPEFICAKFWEVLKKSSGSLFNFRIRGWGKVAPGRAKVSAPAGLEKGMLNWSGKVRLGKVM